MTKEKPPLRWKEPSVLPGFGPALGFTLFYMTVILLLPLAALMARPWELGLGGFFASITTPRVLSALQLSFGMALAAAAINLVFGLIIAWILVRFDFPFRRVVDALIDLPFALPTAVAGIALAALYAENGWIGQIFSGFGMKIAFTPWGILIALMFIGLPFVVRTVQPVLADLDREVEEAAATLGASPAQTFWRVTLPALLPALLTGFALAFARGVGEYGSVIFIAGNLPLLSEIAPVIIVARLEAFDYAGAAAIGVVMLAISFVLLLIISRLQHWARVRSV